MWRVGWGYQSLQARLPLKNLSLKNKVGKLMPVKELPVQCVHNRGPAASHFGATVSTKDGRCAEGGFWGNG